MAEHTPGAWTATPNAGAVWGDGRKIAEISSANGHNSANAALIAAAPDLLLACRDVLYQLNHQIPNGEGPPIDPGTVDDLRARHRQGTR